jgi:twitching motility protein PilT
MCEGGLRGLLALTRKMGGSDLHLSAGSPPRVRVDGKLRSVSALPLTPERTAVLCLEGLTVEQRSIFESTWEFDAALAFASIGRFRCNLFRQKGSVAGVYRAIPDRVPSIAELGLPAALGALADRPRGLVLVTGPTGSGKSTTLAALVDRINTTRAVHVLTIEDPIEFLHGPRLAIVNQRELHTDTRSLPAALRAALREDPDVVLVGELRDCATMAAALELAETGHLTLATLHTNSAVQTISRLVDAFPAAQQSQVRTQLSLVLEGVASQVLVPKIGGGRVAAFEVLVATAAVRTLIRDDKIHQIYGAMQAGQSAHGMQTMNQALAQLANGRVVSWEEASRVSARPDELALACHVDTRREALARPNRQGACR